MTRHASTVLAAAHRIGATHPTGRVDLAPLRDALPELSRTDVDEALRVLHHQRRIVLSRNDNTPAITRRDHAAALYVGECPRHIAYLMGAP